MELSSWWNQPVFVPQHKVQDLCRSRLWTVSKSAVRTGLSPSPILSLPLLDCGPVKHVPHACRLLLEELAVLSALLGPGRVERRGVLVHQVGVLGATRPPKVFDL